MKRRIRDRMGWLAEEAPEGFPAAPGLSFGEERAFWTVLARHALEVEPPSPSRGVTLMYLEGDGGAETEEERQARVLEALKRDIHSHRVREVVDEITMT